MKRVLLGFVIVVGVMTLGVAAGFITANLNTKPDIANDIRPPASSQIYDINGNEIANVHADENRMPVKINQVPKNLQNAFVLCMQISGDARCPRVALRSRSSWPRTPI